MLKKYLSKQKGVLVSDAIVSILIILVFAGTITTLIYNIVLESMKVKMESKKISIFTNIFEYVEKMPYSSITANNICNYINNNEFNIDNVSAVADKGSVNTLTTAYKVVVKVEQYTGTEDIEVKYDLVKKVTIIVENTLSGNTYSSEMSTIKKANSEETKEIVENAQNT